MVVTDGGTPALSADPVTFHITVTAVNQAPVIGAIGTQVLLEGHALSLTATATDPDAGDTQTFSKVAGPAWVTFS